MGKILIVDDEKNVLNAMYKTLSRGTGHDVTAVETGTEAISIMAENSFDLVITDIIMPDIAGFELISHISSKYPDTKVIAVSGGGKIASDQYLMVAGKIGAEMIMKKPFGGDEILEAVEKVLAG